MMNIYSKIKNMIKVLKKTTEHFSIGKTSLGKNLDCFVVDGRQKDLNKKDCKTIIIQSCIHAREYITAFLAVKLIEYLKNFRFDGRIYILPLMNPDGVDICANGTRNVKNKRIRENLNQLLKYQDKALFKANANGVDLNTNFDVSWGNGKQNIHTYPWYENFVGFKPNSENEVKNLIKFTKKLNPNLTISYHSKGNVIFYGFNGQDEKTKCEQQKYLKILKDETKYRAIFTKNSCGGYKDYCLLKLGIVGFTIEVGDDFLSHPIGEKHLNKIFTANKNLVLKLLKV